MTREVPSKEETYEEFDYFLFTALMDTRDYLFSIIQDRSVPVKLRWQKLLVCAHDFQLPLDKMNFSSGRIFVHDMKGQDLRQNFRLKYGAGLQVKVLLQTKILMLWHLIQISGIVILPHWN